MIHHYDTVADFVADPSFVAWITQPTPALIDHWSAWQKAHPDKQSLVEEARHTVLLLHFRKSNFSSDDAQRLQRRIQRTLDQDERKTKRAGQTSRWYLRAAATFVGLLLSVGLLIWWIYRPTVYSTRYGETRTVMLPDSSKVILNANSTLTYRTNWSNQQNREVSLQGEAFFYVRHKRDSVKFTVHTDQLDVEVLGTEFNVNTRRQATQVVLNSGSVRLRSEQAHELLMQPGEMVTLAANLHTYQKEVVEPARYGAWREQRLEFDRTPVMEIFQQLEDTYGLEIEVEASRVTNKRYTGSSPANDLPMLFDKLSKLYGLRIRQDGQKVRVSDSQKKLPASNRDRQSSL